MQLGEIYRWLVQKGKEADVRTEEELDLLAEERKEKFRKSKDKGLILSEDQDWDNPYGDTKILYGSEERYVSRALVGIDVDGSEFLLADKERQRCEPIDLIITHHPQGRAQIQLFQVMKVQEEMLYEAGVPINVAEALMSQRINEVQRALLPANHQKNVDLARILDIPFLAVHSPADNQVQKYLTNYLIKENKEHDEKQKIKDIIEMLLDLPEYRQAAQYGMVPQVIAGNPQNRTGKLYIKMNGGTAGPEKSIDELAKAGIGTIICMHLPEAQRKRAAELHLRVIVAGHMASDSLGMNLLMDGLEKKGVEIIPCGGFIRHRRETPQ
ncbi:NGG1p interacting factor NIF3 [Heliorestis convoluta]|uniref:NIF3 (NGG1p interacting factor 3)-like protein, putative n=1 Tax=Heliorestis convoluta TaxID=356322 RepID=A0A5Q2N2Z6_9FIRM|nr:NGG1p interacting factor NIF3 [Heliorestis convoluta]QGG46945.1 NIF3 (NGG1p interacting factor 3)-like protein, putative [Heliorestis convoluta]